jgi:hypothetical protein
MTDVSHSSTSPRSSSCFRRGRRKGPLEEQEAQGLAGAVPGCGSDCMCTERELSLITHSACSLSRMEREREGEASRVAHERKSECRGKLMGGEASERWIWGSLGKEIGDA